MLNLATVDFKNRLFSAFNERFVEKLKDAMSEKDPTIDWSNVVVVCDFEINHFHFEAKNDRIHKQLRIAYEQVLADNDKPEP